MPSGLQRHRVRWRIFALLVGLAMNVYFQQRSLTVAAERIMPELSFSQMQIGWLQWAFVLSYGLFQFPGGILGQRVGARPTLFAIGLLAVAAAVTVPVAPSILAGTALFGALLCAQFVLGAAHAPFFPVCAGVMEAWLPANRWAFAQGLLTMGGQVGAALAPPVIVFMMQAFGWQRALFWTAFPALALLVVWVWYSRNSPREHPAVSAAELAALSEIRNAPVDTHISWRRILLLLCDRNILTLTASYVCMNYVFYLLSNWSFLYLVQNRHFTVFESGWLAALPPLGAALGAAIGGGLCDLSCALIGRRWGFRLIPLVALPGAGGLLLIALYGSNPYLVVAALVLCFGAVELTEGSYWGGTMQVATGDTMAATGILNTGGNLGGIIGIPIVAYLSGHEAWNSAFLIGIAFAAVAAIAWLGVDVTRPIVADIPHAGRP